MPTKTTILPPQVQQPTLSSLVRPHALLQPRVERWAKRWLHPPGGVEAALGEAMVWLAIAALVRIGVDWMLTLSTLFWLPVLGILVAPALLAILLSHQVPALSLVLGYRLLLILIGLLLGGRL